MTPELSHLSDEQLQQCFPDSPMASGPAPSIAELANTGAGLTTMIVFGAVILTLGIFLAVSHRRRASTPASIHNDPNSHKLHSVATAVAVLASGAWTFTGAATAQADTLEPGLPEFCYEDPTLTVAKNDAGDDKHEVEPGQHDITVTIVNTSDEALEDFTINDVTETGQDAVFNDSDLEALTKLNLKPGETFTLAASVEVDQDETHRNNLTVTATGALSAKVAEASDPTTLIGPNGPEPIEPPEPENPEEPEEPTANEVVAIEPGVIRQCDIEPTITLPEVEGVEYTTHRDGEQLIVTATTVEGYEFSEGQQTQWGIDMTFDTSAWNEEAWGIDDPVDWYGTIQEDETSATWEDYVDLAPVSQVVGEQLYPELTKDDFTNWIAEAQDAGASIDIGEPTVQRQFTQYDEDDDVWFAYGYDEHDEWTRIESDSRWHTIQVHDVPGLHVATGKNDMGVSHLVTKPSNFNWHEQYGQSGIQATRSYTWPITLTTESGLCTQSKTLEATMYVHPIPD